MPPRDATAQGIAEEAARAIAARIVELRAERGMSRAKLARAAGLHESNVVRIERGTHLATIESVIRIARALGVPSSSIFAVLN